MDESLSRLIREAMPLAAELGCVVFAISCARWRPRRRSIGAGPSRSASTPAATRRSRSSCSAASGALGSGPETRIETRWRNGG